MTLHRWLLAVFALSGTGLALAQRPFWAGPVLYGRAAFPRGRVVFGFAGPRGPFDPLFFQPRMRVTYITILSPPPYALPSPSFLDLPTPRDFDREDDPPPLPPRRETVVEPMPPDIPAVPEVPPVPDIPPMVGDPAPAPPPPMPEEKPPAPRPKPRPKAGDDEPPLPGPPEPFDDPVQEQRRQLELGRTEFATRQYGRAAQRFRRAGDLQPRDALPRFLLAQCLFAVGKYHEASDAIVEGLRFDPDWPRGGFRAIDLYGADVLSYPEHARQLDEARTRFPGEPVLEFLAGCQAWFDGRHEAAAALFRRAQPPFADASERFLRAMPAGDAI